MPVAPFVVDLAGLVDERWDRPDRGRIGWRTLISGDRTPTEALTAGVAILAPGDRLLPHRHTHPELYYGLEGTASVTIEGETHAIAPGVAIFIPGDALHGVEADDGPARYLYVFAADSFAEVVYRFPADPETEAADVP